MHLRCILRCFAKGFHQILLHSTHFWVVLSPLEESEKRVLCSVR
uniref:Uncharacterized protein n=1 Tax=Arundo donax TaxID=35708 RepID=A0A0A9GE43_ARUDO